MSETIIDNNIKDSYLASFIGYDVFNHSNTFKKNASMLNSAELASFIRTNNTSLKSNDSMLFNVYKKITPFEKVLKDVLTYEFLFYEPSDLEKVNTIDELINISLLELKKYQGIVGGFYIEDVDWLLCTSESRFEPKSNQKLIYNSIEKHGCYDKDNVSFLRNFVNHMKKFISNDKITMNYKLLDDENNEICWILFVFEIKT